MVPWKVLESVTTAEGTLQLRQRGEQAPHQRDALLQLGDADAHAGIDVERYRALIEKLGLRK